MRVAAVDRQIFLGLVEIVEAAHDLRLQGGALFEQIQFANGRILNPHFAQYRVPRFSDAPQIEVVLLDRKDLPSAGAGESGIIGLAPAVGNAIFAATGTRLRDMPMAPLGAAPAKMAAENLVGDGVVYNSGATG